MVFSRNKDIPKLKLLINGNEIEQVKSFQYLGALVTEDGRCEYELNRIIAVAKNNFSKMSRILTHHDMSLATKIRLAQCYVWSTQTNEMKLRGFLMWMYRRIGRVSWKAKKTNKEVLNKLGLQSTKLMTVVRQRIVRFYGHVRRHDSLQRIITEGMVNGKRGRGRKRCGWLGNVSRYAGMNINRCAEIATNREEWRTIVSNVVSDKEQRPT